jgi:hypothetical protein
VQENCGDATKDASQPNYYSIGIEIACHLWHKCKHDISAKECWWPRYSERCKVNPHIHHGVRRIEIDTPPLLFKFIECFLILDRNDKITVSSFQPIEFLDTFEFLIELLDLVGFQEPERRLRQEGNHTD